ncbi:hypothetical protein HanRHA438_Chr16g0783851 [Helianthus annuus]|uniref:Uncharacterized protein n=1 Tax=Helianthus annuus TaxID=4232 RepID=A0A9K3H026_HELAN|nr:hypothetical protein HanXRQr2_Chr16g0773361 [Helianthus annuus]KAJ0445111.1 hypothetical protein HanIR_Chr16g0839321 [Helianthus annuus]KAJ0823269.1 hypothetical protein HanPSC8_Chr16g0741771 [Helianthus annuus]KAJ0837963.1 hypothetical protein HanRHA438_Chr16g0783851 [Helianthus annuus]
MNMSVCVYMCERDHRSVHRPHPLRFPLFRQHPPAHDPPLNYNCKHTHTPTALSSLSIPAADAGEDGAAVNDDDGGDEIR